MTKTFSVFKATRAACSAWITWSVCAARATRARRVARAAEFARGAKLAKVAELEWSAKITRNQLAIATRRATWEENASEKASTRAWEAKRVAKSAWEGVIEVFNR